MAIIDVMNERAEKLTEEMLDTSTLAKLMMLWQLVVRMSVDWVSDGQQKHESMLDVASFMLAWLRYEHAT
jgi:hypothetical protein